MSSSKFHRRFEAVVHHTGSGAPDEQFLTDDGLIIRENTVSRGGSIPNYRRVIASGGNATTNLSGVLWTFAQSQAFLKSEVKHIPNPAVYDSESEVSGNILPLSIPGSGIPTLELSEISAKNLALTRYYQNLASVSSSYKGMVFTGELPETLRMIRHPARALRNGIGNYLSFLRKKSGRVAKRQRPSFVRKTWLEYSFGWKPLINDIDGAISAFYQSKWAHPIFEMVKGTGRDSTSIMNSDNINIDVGGGHRLKASHRSEEEVYVKYFGIYRSDGRGIPNSHSYGFSPWEFIPTIWELMPYSFLVDYFSNIGAILSSWSYRFLANGWTSRTIRRTFEHSCFDVRHVPDEVGYPRAEHTFVTIGDPGTASYKVVSVNRSRDAILEIPSLELKVPGNWTQWANIVALTTSLSQTRKALAR
jgi:hypothetical protein